MSLVRVWTNVGQKKPKALLAKIFSSAEGPVYTIRYLSADSDEDDRGRLIHKYEDETYEVDDDSVAEWLGVDDETDIGFTRVGEDEWVKGDPDSDYVPDSSEEDETDSDDEDDPTDDDEMEEIDDEDYGGEDEPEENDDYE
jgi:hypothetical protein